MHERPFSAVELVQQLSQWKEQGISRNDAFVKLTRMQNQPLNADLLVLLSAVYPADVTQERQETQDNHGNSSNSIEKERKRASLRRQPQQAPKQPRQNSQANGMSIANFVAEAAQLQINRNQAFHAQYQNKTHVSWQSPMFLFVRTIKSHPVLGELEASKAWNAVRGIIDRWRSQMPDPWYQCFNGTEEDAVTEFLDAWDKVRYLPGQPPLEIALARAIKQPLDVSKGPAKGRPPGYAMFVSMAGWLQVVMGNRVILLPVDNAAELLNVRKMTISRYRKMAIKDGYLRETKPYQFGGKKRKGQATEFRFDVALFDVLREASAAGTEASFRNDNQSGETPSKTQS